MVKSDPVPLDSEGRFSLMIDDGYCETVWIIPPLSCIHPATWWIPLKGLPIIGPLFIGSRTDPLGEIAIELLKEGIRFHELRIDPRIIREGRYVLHYEVGRIACP